MAAGNSQYFMVLQSLNLKFTLSWCVNHCLVKARQIPPSFQCISRKDLLCAAALEVLDIDLDLAERQGEIAKDGK